LIGESGDLHQSLPPGGRWIFAMLKHRKKTEGELRNVEFAHALCYAILPQSPSVTAPWTDPPASGSFHRREPIFNLPDKPEFEDRFACRCAAGKGLPALRGTCQKSDKPEFAHPFFKVFWSAEPFFQKRFCIPRSSRPTTSNY